MKQSSMTIRDLREAWYAADHAWQAQLNKQFGKVACNVRYTKEGEGKPGSRLRELYDAVKLAKANLDKETKGST